MPEAEWSPESTKGLQDESWPNPALPFKAGRLFTFMSQPQFPFLLEEEDDGTSVYICTVLRVGLTRDGPKQGRLWLVLLFGKCMRGEGILSIII